MCPPGLLLHQKKKKRNETLLLLPRSIIFFRARLLFLFDVFVIRRGVVVYASVDRLNLSAPFVYNFNILLCGNNFFRQILFWFYDPVTFRKYIYIVLLMCVFVLYPLALIYVIKCITSMSNYIILSLASLPFILKNIILWFSSSTFIFVTIFLRGIAIIFENSFRFEYRPVKILILAVIS